MNLKDINTIIKEVNSVGKIGKIIEIIGLTIVADGPTSSIGDLCHIISEGSKEII